MSLMISFQRLLIGRLYVYLFRLLGGLNGANPCDEAEVGAKFG